MSSQGLTIGIPKEILEGEMRVAAVPKLIAQLKKDDREILVESDAGQIDVNLRYQLYYPEKRPWELQVTIDDSCLGRDEKLCQNCSDQCGFVAISFVVVARGIDKPVINKDLCNGCGACVSVCPENSISVSNKI